MKGTQISVSQPLLPAAGSGLRTVTIKVNASLIYEHYYCFGYYTYHVI
jgi:hypothetical protein